MEDAPQFQVEMMYQLVEVDAATLEMMGGAEMLMPGGPEMLAQGETQVYGHVFTQSGPESPMQFCTKVCEQAPGEREKAYWEDWEEERIQGPSFPPPMPLPVIDGWAGCMQP